MHDAKVYADNAAVQLRKGLLTYCVLKVCGQKALYTSDIIERLRQAELIVVEGTIYPLLSRLQKDRLLTHEWQESEQGPPRKYYKVTPFGEDVKRHIAEQIKAINKTLNQL